MAFPTESGLANTTLSGRIELTHGPVELLPNYFLAKICPLKTMFKPQRKRKQRATETSVEHGVGTQTSEELLLSAKRTR